MLATMHSLTLLLALSALVAQSAAHMAIMQLEAFHSGDSLSPEMAFPLNSGSGSTSDWFFRGLKPSNGKGTIKLKAGGSIDLKIGCDPSGPAEGQSCDDGGGSLHSSDGSRTGCGLAISYKDFADIKPEDLTVFSTLDDCVHQNTVHTFKIPSNLPATASGKPATCAWGWIPSASASADEMYMTGFSCEVTGSSAAVGSTISNAKSLPFQYFAVSGFGSSGERPSWKGSYKTEGAQKLVISGSSSSSNSTSKASTGKKSASASSNSTGSSTTKKAAKQCKSKRKRGVVDLPGMAPIVARDEIAAKLKRHPHLRARAIR